MAGRNKNSNRNRNISTRRRNSARSRNFQLRRYKNGAIHEALISRIITAYPIVNDDWLSKLAWAGSMALKLYKTISINTMLDGSAKLEDSSVTTNAGQVLLLGPSDFAAKSPFVISCFDSDAAKRLTSFLTYERISLPELTVRVFPCVDVSQRAGMFAAYLQPLDYINDDVDNMLCRFSAEYEEVIKHPNVKVGPTSRPMNLKISRRAAPIAPCIIEGKEKSSMPGNYYNRDPWYVLVVAFSDLATKMPDTAAYSTERAAFEIHLKGKLRLFNPSPVLGSLIENKTIDNESMVSERICNLDPKKTSYRFYNIRFDAKNGTKISELEPDILDKIDSIISESELEYVNIQT